MFNFLKNKSKKVFEMDEEAIRKSNEDILKEHEYKMENDPEYRKSFEKDEAFFRQTVKHGKKPDL